MEGDGDGDGSSAPSPLYVVIFPWLAFGHLIPCLGLAERLAERGHRVSFVSTPRNIARLPPLRPAAVALVDFVALPFPRIDGIPDGAESTNDAPHNLLWKAFDLLKTPFSEFLGSACAGANVKRPDWVIVDVFHHLAAATAVEHKVPCAMALIAGGASMSDGRVRPVMEGVPAFELKQIKKMLNDNSACGISLAERVPLTLQRCSLVAMRTSIEWEPDTLPLVPTLYGKPVVPLGLMPPSPAAANGEGGPALRWLDEQPANSVLYVALGSEVPLCAEQVHELALGLEFAGTRFLWALRKPSGVARDADVLPPGFEERMRHRGLVVMGWAPQLRILAHGAVASFLTHCGWSSIIEGLLFGRPLVMLPMFGDQGPSARLMEGRKVGVQVPRDNDDGSFHREGVASAVRAVVVEEESRKVFVANAKKWQEIVADRDLHERYMDEFIQRLRSFKA